MEFSAVGQVEARSPVRRSSAEEVKEQSSKEEQ